MSRPTAASTPTARASTTVTVEQVRDLLAHLYDPGHLQTHPLTALVPGSERAHRGRTLQRVLLDAVEALKPPREGNPGPKAIRRYQLLKRRYADGLAPEAVQRELLVGRSEYYREHQEALEATASLLSERLTAVPSAPADPEPAPTAPAAESTDQLPAYLTSFVGREAEIAAVADLLGRTRLLTLSGAGGCGKTRLAVHAARGLAPSYPVGVWFVDLAPLADPSLVVGAVLAALGLREGPGRDAITLIAAYLGGRAALLVLDNCEHLVAACARVAEALLAASPNLRVLATSREALGVAGETVWRIPSLPAPGPDVPPTPAELAAYPAVRLFVERAAAVEPSFAVTGANAGAIARICRRLDGIPLALEMAAARAGVLAVEQIAGRLDEALGPASATSHLLTGGSRTAPPRQQTLRATLDWSHDLLAEPERVLLRRLAVFAGGWTIEASEAVGRGEGIEPGEVLDLLTALIGKSLVLAEGRADGEARYRLLETIRAYGLERLAESGEGIAVRGRHAAHYLALAEEAEPELEGPGAADRLRRLDREHDNMRAALGWFAEAGDAQTALRLANALAMFWYFRGHVTEARARLEALLALPGAAAPTQIRARALSWAGWLGRHTGDDQERRRVCADALALARALTDERTVARALVALGVIDVDRDPATARSHLAEGLTIGRRLGDRWSIGVAALFLGVAALFEGDYAAADAALAESLAVARAMGNRWTTAASLEWLGNAALERGDAAAAYALFGESLAINREIHDRWGEANALQGLGRAAHAQRDGAAARAHLSVCLALQRDLGDLFYLPATLEEVAVLAAERAAGAGVAEAVRALRLGGAAHALRARGGWPLSKRARATLDAALAAARQRVGDAAATAWAEGETMASEQAIVLALADDPADEA